MAVEYLKEYSKLLLVILIYQRFFNNVTMFCLLILFGRFEDFAEYGYLQIVLEKFFNQNWDKVVLKNT